MATNSENIKFQKQSNTSTLVGIVLILASIVLYTFYTRQVVAEVGQMDEEIATKTEQIEQMQSKLDEFARAETELDLSTNVQKLLTLNAIPVGLNQDEVIRELIELTETYDVNLTSLSFGQGSAGKDGIGSLRINSSFEGNYSDLIGFLEGIEKGKRLFKVSTITVQLKTLSISDSKRATFSLTMEAYFQQK